MAGYTIAVIMFVILLTAKAQIINLFTSDPKVIEEVSNVWIFLASFTPVSATLGIFENVVMVRQRFRFLFWVTFVSVVVAYLPLWLAAGLYFKSLMVLWIAHYAMLTIRMIPTAIASLRMLSSRDPDLATHTFTTPSINTGYSSDERQLLLSSGVDIQSDTHGAESADEESIRIRSIN